MKTRQIEPSDCFGIRLIHQKGSVAPSFWEDAPHSHDHCELFVHIRGSLDIFVEKNLYHLSGNEIRVYRSGELHCGKAQAVQEMEWYQLSIPRAFFADAAHAPLASVFFDREAGSGNVFVSDAQEEAVRLLREVFTQDGRGSPLLSAYCRSAVVRILCLFNDPDGNRSVRGHRDRVLEGIIERIDTDFRQIGGLADLCRLTHYSPSYLHRLFRDRLNVTPYQWIVGKKLNEAKKALWSGASVTDACEAAGFNNYSNFITLFKKSFGMTPKKYQEQHRT